MSATLRARDPEYILRNAHRILRRSSRYRMQVLWVFVSEMTGHGCGYSHDICNELGWNPNALVKDALPPMRLPDSAPEERT